MELKQGTLLKSGTYRIVRFINSGGFGCTYEAEHLTLDDRFAIKEFFVKDFCNRDENSRHVTVGTIGKKPLVEKLKNKFVDEAKSIRKLKHDGIVRVSDVFEENGTAYYAMDYIKGRSLKQIVDESGGLSEAKSLYYIRQVAVTLSYVHSKNILHLDIKPENIMIDENDRAILIDFGISKQYDEEAGENTSTLMGKTPGYAPPEQMANTVVKFTPSTDIYSIGATLYKLLTGQTPVDSSLRASGAVVLDPLPDTISESTRAAIYKSMSLNRNDRPQSIEEFIEILGGTPTSNNLNYSNSSHISKDEVTIITGVPCKENEIKDTEIFEVNGVTFKMIKVEGGTFQMGAQSDDPNGTNYDSDAYDLETPVHSVTLSDYYIGETEVTQELWEAVMGSNPSSHKGKQRPVERVSWNDCQCFLEKLTYMTGKGFRLPTEAEWEYAARGGRKSKNHIFSGGNYIDNVAVYGRGVFKKTTDVKTKMPNELGIYDMSGNVWEWCQDWYGSDYYSSSPQYNPQGPSSGSYRVLRGGSWDSSARYCRVSNRNYNYPDYRDNSIGLRLSFS